MEQAKPQTDYYTIDKKLDNLVQVFGEEGATKLMSQITHDNSTLYMEDVVDYAWSLIPEATAYAMPAEQKDLTDSAINIHEGCEAFRRIAE